MVALEVATAKGIHQEARAWDAHRGQRPQRRRRAHACARLAAAAGAVCADGRAEALAQPGGLGGGEEVGYAARAPLRGDGGPAGCVGVGVVAVVVAAAAAAAVVVVVGQRVERLPLEAPGAAELRGHLQHQADVLRIADAHGAQVGLLQQLEGREVDLLLLEQRDEARQPEGAQNRRHLAPVRGVRLAAAAGRPRVRIRLCRGSAQVVRAVIVREAHHQVLRDNGPVRERLGPGGWRRLGRSSRPACALGRGRGRPIGGGRALVVADVEAGDGGGHKVLVFCLPFGAHRRAAPCPLRWAGRGGGALIAAPRP
mmetsp:Transcript_4791/g.17241  ORF Transcript_4791/g.17241 Transcript_4791/m.17241 type:complete len:312 (+) Transcript_4791:1036-1971(+)